jgi:hypothetical protein
MREAIGGAWLLSITVALIALFTAYLAFSVNYSKAFKVKDAIVERVEKYEGFDTNNTQEMKEIREYLSKIGYNTKGKCNQSTGFVSGSQYYGVDGSNIRKNDSNTRFNFCVERVTKAAGVGDYSSAYYKVTVFYGLSLGFVDLNSIFFLTGETKNIYYPKDMSVW